MTNKKKTSHNLIFPKHIAIIMDGNGRWASKRGLERKIGHYFGGINMGKIVEYISNLKTINMLSLFMFSCDNFKRPKEEVDFIFNKPIEYIDEIKIKKIVDSNIVVRHIGYRNGIPNNFLNLLDKIIELTKNNSGLVVNMCINYSARREFDNNKLLLDDDVDLLIRTGKRKRLSDFLLFQSAYAEIFFSNKYWPSFDKKDVNKAINFYRKQERTFGGLR